MSQDLFHTLRGFFQSYGYWTVAIALLLENAGLPLPGENRVRGDRTATRGGVLRRCERRERTRIHGRDVNQDDSAPPSVAQGSSPADPKEILGDTFDKLGFIKNPAGSF